MSKIAVKDQSDEEPKGAAFAADNLNLRAELSARYDFSRLIGNSNAMRAVYEQVAQVACSNTTVLISGESGTGKELVAHALHLNSPRAAGVFVKVNCAALPEDLIESELFGHERGAFTSAHQRRQGRFELAAGGTLFLDEIGELSLPAQAKLLRVLQTREFERVGGTETLSANVRLIAATNRELEKELAAGRFRADLYYRLNIFPITLPPLRERKEDIPQLIEHFLARLNQERGSQRQLSPLAYEALLGYDWPGNVRELQNAVERAYLMAEGEVLHHYHLPQPLQETSENGAASLGLFEAVEAFERDLIRHALRTTRGNRNQAAKLLRLSERALAYKVRKHGIDHTDFRSE
jgi:Nif-specific regulatory protein